MCLKPRIVNVNDVKKAVKELCIKACIELTDDLKEAFKRNLLQEKPYLISFWRMLKLQKKNLYLYARIQGSL